MSRVSNGGPVVQNIKQDDILFFSNSIFHLEDIYWVLRPKETLLLVCALDRSLAILGNANRIELSAWEGQVHRRAEVSQGR